MTSFTLFFNLDFTPNTWGPELEIEFGTNLNKKKDLRTIFSFLHATENILMDILAEKLPSWDLDNIALNEKNYSVSITKGVNNSELKLLITSNQINLLEKKIIKQNIQINDPFHWTKIVEDKKTSDIDFLNTLYNGLKSPISNIESLNLNRPPNLGKDFDHEIKILKDLMSMTENYLKQRINKPKKK